MHPIFCSTRSTGSTTSSTNSTTRSTTRSTSSTATVVLLVVLLVLLVVQLLLLAVLLVLRVILVLLLLLLRIPPPSATDAVGLVKMNASTRRICHAVRCSSTSFEKKVSDLGWGGGVGGAGGGVRGGNYVCCPRVRKVTASMSAPSYVHSISVRTKITSVLPVRANGQSIHVRTFGTSISAVTFAENAVNSSIFVLDEEDAAQIYCATHPIFCGVGWRGGGGNYVSDRRTLCVTRACEQGIGYRV